MRWLFGSRGFFLSPRPFFACGRLQLRTVARTPGPAGREEGSGTTLLAGQPSPPAAPAPGMQGSAEQPRRHSGSRSRAGETITAARCRNVICSPTSFLISGKVEKNPSQAARAPASSRSSSLGDPEYHDCIDSIILYNVILCICVIATNRVERHTKINDLEVNMAE